LHKHKLGAHERAATGKQSDMPVPPLLFGVDLKPQKQPDISGIWALQTRLLSIGAK
jgi:hypothetical protein